MTATTVAELLLDRQDDHHPALLFDDRSWSWAQFVAECGVRARVLQSLRRPGPFHIGVLLENVPEYLFLMGGAALAGAVVVGINPTRRGAQLAQDIGHTDCQLLVTDAQGAELVGDVDGDLPVARIDQLPFLDLLTEHRDGALEPAAVPGEPLLLMFTSGSTGAPKAVICSNRRLARLAVSSAAGLGITRDDVLYQSMPLFHGNAVMTNVLPAIASGATIAMRRKFSASGFLPDVRRYHATFFNYVGRALAYVLATPELVNDNCNDLRLGFGTEASARDVEIFQRRFGCEIRENYGSSEGVIAIRRRPGTPPDAMGLPPVGSPMDVIVADPVTGLECPPALFDSNHRLLNPHEAIGEIVDRAGAERFEGYYRNDEAQAQRVRSGWYWSGDLGYRDAEGWFYFAGRGSDWLRVDSENFAAAPIERILNDHDPVAVSAVYPVPDARTGDQVMAALELRPGAEFDPAALWAYLQRHPDLGTKWCPRFVRILDHMPLTANGKVDKQPLRDLAWIGDGAVYWRPENYAGYRLLTADDRARLDEAFDANGRAHLAPSVGGDELVQGVRGG